MSIYNEIPLMHAGNWRWASIFPFLSPLISHQIDFDQKNESLDEQNSQGISIDPNDIHAMRVGYIISKLVALLSVPFWMLYAFLVMKAWTKKGAARVIAFLILLAICTSSAISWMFVYEMSGTEIATWEILFTGK